MGDEEETRVCGRCQKEVAEANFSLHESHCSRFLRLCPECKENVPVSELDEHRREQHAEVKCSKCRKTMERRFLPEHEEEECPGRVRPCVFCELELPWAELQEHAAACGSRTEACADCGRYVRLSHREEHSRGCPEQDAPAPAARGAGRASAAWKLKELCKVCRASFPVEEIQKHEMSCTAAPKWEYEESDSDDSDQASGEEFNSQFRNLDLPRSVGAERGGGAARSESRDPYELSVCPHCQLILPWVTLCWHVDKCKVHVHLKHREL